MIRKIAHTVITRGFSLAAGFVLVFLTARLLGAEIRGEISLLTFALSLIGAMASIIGGPVMVYQASRIPSPQLTVLTLIWSLAVSVLVPPILVAIDLIPFSLWLHTMVLGFLLAVFTSFAGISLGKRELSLYNNLNMLQALLLPVAFLFFYLLTDNKSIDVFLYSLYIAYGLPAVFSALKFYNLYNEKRINNEDSGNAFFSVFRQGMQIQLATFFQLISYRAGFYFLEYFNWGFDSVGVFSVAVALGEAAWVISKSLATIQYSQIAASREEKFNRNLTWYLLKISLAGTSILALALLFIPDSVFTFVFGEEFSSVGALIPWLLPGIIFMAGATILTHYFSGKGQNSINIYASLNGAVAAIILCFIMIPAMGGKGAGIATSGGYLMNLLVLTFFYLRATRKTSISIE